MKIYAVESDWDGIISYHQYSDGAWSAARSFHHKNLNSGETCFDWDMWLENNFIRVIEIEVQWDNE